MISFSRVWYPEVMGGMLPGLVAPYVLHSLGADVEGLRDIIALAPQFRPTSALTLNPELVLVYLDSLRLSEDGTSPDSFRSTRELFHISFWFHLSSFKIEPITEEL